MARSGFKSMSHLDEEPNRTQHDTLRQKSAATETCLPSLDRDSRRAHALLRISSNFPWSCSNVALSPMIGGNMMLSLCSNFDSV